MRSQAQRQLWERLSGEWRVEELKALVEQGADVNAKDDSGQTALHAAAAHGRSETLTLLVELGADMRAQTPLEARRYTPPPSTAMSMR